MGSLSVLSPNVNDPEFGGTAFIVDGLDGQHDVSILGTMDALGVLLHYQGSSLPMVETRLAASLRSHFGRKRDCVKFACKHAQSLRCHQVPLPDLKYAGSQFVI